MLLFTVATVAVAENGDSIVAGNFEQKVEGATLPAFWEQLEFSGVTRFTDYGQVDESGMLSVRATSQASASALLRRLSLDPHSYSQLSFSWKIQDILTAADITKKAGDDAPARVYVTFAYDAEKVSIWEKIQFETIRLLYGEYPPIASLVYVWASHQKQGSIIESPYTKRAKVIVLESGAAKKGQWVFEKRNVYRDFCLAFATQEVPMISGVAIMTDTDNSASSGVAWYGNIVFSKPSSLPAVNKPASP